MKNLSLSFLCLLLAIASFTSCSSVDRTRAVASEAMEQNNPDEVKLMVFYPQPTDAVKFDSDYQDHLALLRKHADIPEDAPPPYTVTKFFPTPEGPADFYQVFIMPFASSEALQQAMSTPGMQEVAADAARISSGGPPVVLVGSEQK